MPAKEKLSNYLTFSILPFISFIMIGLLYSDILPWWTTLHQKVLKTFLIFLFDIILLIFFIIFYISNKENSFDKKRKYLIYFIAYFIYILIQYIVTFFSGEICYDREYHFSNYILLIIFALFIYLYLNNLSEVEIGLIIINIFMIIIVLLSIQEFINILINNENKQSLGTIIASFRPKLTFGNTDYFSGYMIGILPLSIISGFIYLNSKKEKNIYLIIFSFCSAFLGFIPLILSQTRAALIGIFIGIIFVLIPGIIYNISKLKKFVRILIIICFLLILLLTSIIILKYPPPIVKNIIPRLVTTFSNPMFYINDRLNGWSGGLGLFKDHPIFGAGLGSVYASSFKYMNKYFYIYSDSNSFKHSHCEYVEVLGEAGIFGLIFFISLFGFILFMLFRRIYSEKYEIRYKYMCIGVASGIISMLIHQIFSLSLRMSVTMTAYFFLIGLGLFLISYSKKALLINNVCEKKFLFPEYLENNFSKKEIKFLLIIIGILLFISLLLFQRVFRAERAIIKSFNAKYQQEAEYYLSEAVRIMPENPYAWTQKYTLEFNILQNKIKNFQANEQYYQEVDIYFNKVLTDLNKLNSIIPGYQDVWSKLVQLYLTYYDYMLEKWQNTKLSSDLRVAMDSINIALEYLNKSLDMNYLNLSNHILRLVILNFKDYKEQFNESIKDYIIARIYIELGRNRKVVKERININFIDSEKTEIIFEKNNYYINISNNDIKKISANNSGIKDLNLLEKNLTNDFKQIINFDNIIKK